MQFRPATLVRTTARISRGTQRVDLPVWVAFGRQVGPTGLLSAGIHGDEVHAITLLHRFVRQLDLKQLAGRLLIVPVANVSGFHAGSRAVPEHHGGPLGGFRVKVPVSLHDAHERSDDLGNHDSFMVVDVGTDQADPMERLRAIATRTRELKTRHDAQSLDRVFLDLRRISALARPVLAE